MEMNELLEQAKRLHRAGHLEQAMAMYRGLLELDPNNADAHNMLGNAFADRKQWPEAAECYRQALAVDPEKAAAHYNLGNALSALGLLEDAAACYRRAIKLKPQYAAAHFNLGNVLYDLERWEDATAAFRQALDADLSHPDLDAAFNLARSLHRAGRLDEAVAYYRQVVQDKPEFHDAYGALSSALLEAGRPQEALDWHRRALDRNPDEPAAHFYLSRTLLMLGQLEAAEAALRRVLELDPRSGDAYRTLGRVLESLDKREELAALAEQWVQASPDDPQAAHFRAAWTGQHVPPRASDDHVRQTFDSFAAEFDEALGHLDYRAPQLLQAALHAAWGNAGASLEILDAGCGTGLCGPLLRPLARRLVGVDLSRGMLDKARGRSVYDELIEAELTDYLQRWPLTFDAIVAADTLVYFGDLAPVIAVAAGALRGRGILAFTLEHLNTAQDREEFRLEPHGRYSHSESHVRQVLAASGLVVRSIEQAKLRREGDRDVTGLVVLAIRDD